MNLSYNIYLLTSTPTQPQRFEQKTAAVLLASAGLTSAFIAPAPRMQRTRGVARMSFESEAGVTAPLGYWVSLKAWC